MLAEINDGDSIPPSVGGNLAALPYKPQVRVSIAHFFGRDRLERGCARGILLPSLLLRIEARHDDEVLQSWNLRVTLSTVFACFLMDVVLYLLSGYESLHSRCYGIHF